MDLRIKEILKERNLTQIDLAKMLDVSLQNVRQILNKPSLTTATLEKIAEVLDVPMWQLFASPSEVHSIICPHCNKEIKLNINASL